MRVPILPVLLIALFAHSSKAQSPYSIPGPLGVYHMSPNYTYSDLSGNDSTPLQAQFRFGEFDIPNQSDDKGFEFKDDLDSCSDWNANRIMGIIQPLTEGGANNQPADTALYDPFPISEGPGMIQGAQRFSRLSQVYGPVTGIMIDDWNGDTVVTRQMKDALHGKLLDANGNVIESSPATTPENKLYAVTNNPIATPAALSVLDGISYWDFLYQNCCYTGFDYKIDVIRSTYLHKEILVGIYIRNSNLGWTDPVGVEYLLQHALNRYDDGDINGILLFSGPQMVKDFMPPDEWQAFSLPNVLDTLYYPYIGDAQGTMYDCKSDQPLGEVFVRLFCRGRVSGDLLMRSRQKTSPTGHYQFGAWAGNRNTDSTYYWLIAEKSGYISDTLGFWVKRGESTSIPPLCLSTSSEPGESKNDESIFPNPSSGRFTLEVINRDVIYGTVEIYNMCGVKVYSAYQPLNQLSIDLSFQPSGIYVLRIPEMSRQQLLVVQHN